MELGGPLSPEALGSLPTLLKVKAGTAHQDYRPMGLGRITAGVALRTLFNPYNYLPRHKYLVDIL